MPDMRVEFLDDSREPFESLHQFLRDYIAMEQIWFQRFITPEENAVYENGYYEREIDYRYTSGLFAEYGACFSAMKEELAAYKIGGITHFFINKRKIDGDEYDPIMIFNPSDAVNEVFAIDQKRRGNVVYTVFSSNYGLPSPCPSKRAISFTIQTVTRKIFAMSRLC